MRGEATERRNGERRWEKKITARWEAERQRKKDNLDEKEELAEAGQQRQKAPQDTVIHIPKLWKKHSGTMDGGREGERRRAGQRMGRTEGEI